MAALSGRLEKAARTGSSLEKSGAIGYCSGMKWREKGMEKNFSCPVFDVYRSRRQSPLGAEGDFYILDLPDWVTVIPEIEDERGRTCFLMVEQYRHGSGKVTMEFPAGSVDPGEAPEAAARRELLEETGYLPGRFEALAAVSPNPALMNNATHIYRAADLHPGGEQQLDHGEELHVHLIPAEEVMEKMGTGMYDNAIMMTALAFYLRRTRACERLA
jgi:8-oxo-dGTP pyrophosphatase MutT (NUDIX family)